MSIRQTAVVSEGGRDTLMCGGWMCVCGGVDGWGDCLVEGRVVMRSLLGRNGHLHARTQTDRERGGSTRAPPLLELPQQQPAYMLKPFLFLFSFLFKFSIFPSKSRPRSRSRSIRKSLSIHLAVYLPVCLYLHLYCTHPQRTLPRKKEKEIEKKKKNLSKKKMKKKSEFDVEKKKNSKDEKRKEKIQEKGRKESKHWPARPGYTGPA
ncbi:uncharacterized protein K452DRAFT_132729 [Aplosporella prunicola CBS 121167]|uniref:Uncharacterized protein n=1 Tax=Aplosporella prunicola CBS 121167 TaxID=1176127 RepID=A0A6A6BNV7_9PEZI|nr:uncharacterized protein K452DRAFT_132729 [Aplosporella prunicola CBS 121167]KAF2144945.1 hypothetical protein K452DRAFT_132729 [Aplosporella prunicola CBS 121167]